MEEKHEDINFSPSELFNYISKGKSGGISTTNLSDFITQNGFSINDEEIDSILRRIESLFDN